MCAAQEQKRLQEEFVNMVYQTNMPHHIVQNHSVIEFSHLNGD
jgi:hypothetical protein